MVFTRAQARQIGIQEFQALDLSRRLTRRRRRWIARYRARDIYHRHRLPDSKPKDVNVTAYRRREP